MSGETRELDLALLGLRRARPVRRLDVRDAGCVAVARLLRPRAVARVHADVLLADDAHEVVVHPLTPRLRHHLLDGGLDLVEVLHPALGDEDEVGAELRLDRIADLVLLERERRRLERRVELERQPGAAPEGAALGRRRRVVGLLAGDGLEVLAGLDAIPQLARRQLGLARGAPALQADERVRHADLGELVGVVLVERLGVVADLVEDLSLDHHHQRPLLHQPLLVLVGERPEHVGTELGELALDLGACLVDDGVVEREQPALVEVVLDRLVPDPQRQDLGDERGVERAGAAGTLGRRSVGLLEDVPVVAVAADGLELVVDRRGGDLGRVHRRRRLLAERRARRGEERQCEEGDQSLHAGQDATEASSTGTSSPRSVHRASAGSTLFESGITSWRMSSL